ncbi:MAG: hypothetical protein JSS27_09910 [Planctomycetes bacterium]|nr:hypothetical protein [Planctomycetota bacterium]
MPIRFFCPLGHRLIVPRARAGKKGRCPLCHQKLYVPVPDPLAQRKKSTAGQPVKVTYKTMADPPATAKQERFADAVAEELGLGAGASTAGQAPPPDADADAPPRPATRPPAPSAAPPSIEDLAASAMAEEAATPPVPTAPARSPTSARRLPVDDGLPPSFDDAGELPAQSAPSPPATPPEASAPQPPKQPHGSSVYEAFERPAASVGEATPRIPGQEFTPYDTYGVGPEPEKPDRTAALEAEYASIGTRRKSSSGGMRRPAIYVDHAPPRHEPPPSPPVSRDRWFQPVPSLAVATAMRPSADLLMILYWLAGGLAVVGIVGVVLALFESRGELIPTWAQYTMALSVAQVFCGTWLVTLQHWRALRVAALLCVVSAILYAVGVGLFIGYRGASMPLDLFAVRRWAGAWCAAHVFLLGGLAHGCRYLSNVWRTQLAGR